MKEKKLRLSNGAFRIILIPVMALFLALAIAAPIISDYFATSLDTYLGRGQLVYDAAGNGAQYDLADTAYYDQPFKDLAKANGTSEKTEASYQGYKVGEKISDEGEVLLKNDGALPLTKQERVTPMGYRYLDPIMTGTGSGAATLLQSFVVTPKIALKNYFTVNETMENALAAAEVRYATSSGYKGKSDENGTFSGATSSVGEFNSSIYSSSQIGDYKTGLVFIGRQGGEGGDLQTTPYYDGSTLIALHQLQLMPDELNMISFAKKNCSKVIVIVNSPNPMELSTLENDSAINAILWVGTTGSRGFESMGKILTGEVNPSGRLVDLYAKSFVKDPVFQNFGEYLYSNDSSFVHNPDMDLGKAHFVEYEEGIYSGYTYYESRYGKDETAYAEQVLYPFGYGLHYENDKISQTLTDVAYDETSGLFTFTGAITNASSRSVKEAVQIYVDVPYSSASKIEKSTKKLIRFAKYEVAAGASVPFNLTLDKEDLASYDQAGYYSAGSGSYVLESGDYAFFLGKNSHDSWGSKTVSIAKNTVYYPSGAASNSDYVGKRPHDEVLATNQFAYLNDYMAGTGTFGTEGATSRLSRADNFATSTSAPKAKKAADALIEQYNKSTAGSFDYSAEVKARLGDSAPKEGANNGLTLSELRGLDYTDPKWDELLDQLSYSGDCLAQIVRVLGNGAFQTGKISAIGKAVTTESDGPQAIGKTGVSNGTGAANAYPSEIVIASTWNIDLAKAMGEAIGDEALAQNSNGWYAPACNLHRSPFEGRVYEYYSEDPLLSGDMCRYVVEGAEGKGYTCYIKHFAVNEQEFGREALMTWLDEQTLRERYLRPFEITVKEGEVSEKYLASVNGTNVYKQTSKNRKAAMGMMTSMNFLGGVWTSLDNSLTNVVLRDEWGFQGAVITDSATPINAQLNNSLAAGNDFYFSFMQGSLADTTTTQAKLTIRRAVKNICYAIANSNAMQNIGPAMSYHYTISPWRIYIILIDVFSGLVVLGGGTWIILRTRSEKKHPERYRHLRKA
jgi:beta-glucosidase